MIKLQCWMYAFAVKKITAMCTTINESERKRGMLSVKP